MRFQEVDETVTVTFYIGPHPNLLPPQGPIGATLGTAMNNLYSSLKKVSTHYITWLLDLEKNFEICMFLALGALPWAPMYHMNNFEILGPVS